MLGSGLLPLKLRRFARLTVDIRPAPVQHGDVSQNGEYSYLRWLIPDSWPQTLAEVGANDGVTYSNSRNFLEQGWRGVLVEPHPLNFRRLQANVVGDVALFECACSAEAGEAALFDDTGSGGAQLMATLVTADNDWYRHTRSNRSVMVELRRLDDVLNEARMPFDFTFLSVDTEGYDHSVLAGLGEFRPRVVLTERALREVDDAMRKQELLTAAGYLVVDRVGCNEVYVHRDYLGDLAHAMD